MAFDWGGITVVAFGWLRSFIFWGVLLLILLVGTWGSLMIRKRRRLKFPMLEMTNLGGGKQGVILSKCGWFKSRRVLFGLLDWGGDDVMLSKDNRQIQEASSEDFHEINGKRGMIVARKPDDPRILVPLNKLEISNSKLLAEIAPADFRDASSKILKQAE